MVSALSILCRLWSPTVHSLNKMHAVPNHYSILDGPMAGWYWQNLGSLICLNQMMQAIVTFLVNAPVIILSATDLFLFKM